jgi:signal transduction histidine kinase
MEQMERTSRLASIGRLAAGVAHEINNPLAIISESTGLIKDLFTLEKRCQEDQRVMELIDDVLESVERCGEITKNLLGFARHLEPKIQPVRLNSVLREVLAFLKKEAQYRNIALDINIPEETPMVYSDRGKLQQIFLNLINNAFQAMAPGGRLEISAATPDQNHVAISICDNGSGISDEDKKRIFEPFFTTKDPKVGTGLGLSITYGLVHSLQGDISLESKIGEGTTFVVTLPLRLKGERKNEGPIG